jgi:multisubunit Na+/H+ antiporter MnhF subunit
VSQSLVSARQLRHETRAQLCRSLKGYHEWEQSCEQRQDHRKVYCLWPRGNCGTSWDLLWDSCRCVGLGFTVSQFWDFWYFIVSLAAGFGIQIGLFTYLRNAVRGMDMSGRVVAVSGTTSTVAMISCCAHYLTNILPVVGAAGAIALVAQYQIEFFWFGLVSNLAAIVYMGNRVVKFTRAHALK